MLSLDIQLFMALTMSYVIKYGFCRIKVKLDKFLMLEKANKLAFSSLTRNFALTLQRQYGITKGENGERALLGRDEQWRAAVVGSGLWHHLRTIAGSVGLRYDGDAGGVLCDCQRAAVEWFQDGAHQSAGAEARGL